MGNTKKQKAFSYSEKWSHIYLTLETTQCLVAIEKMSASLLDLP